MSLHEPNPGGSQIIFILNRSDQLTQDFKKIYNESIHFVQGLKSIETQYENLNQFNQSTFQSSSSSRRNSNDSPDLKERTLNRLNQSKNELTMKIIESLNRLESVIDQLSESLYSIDDQMQQIGSSNGFNPKQALDHLNFTFDSYQSELISKRELFSEFNSEVISLDQFLISWMKTDRLDLLNQERMDELSECLQTWST
ncbi:hypothetical protein DFH28DRAFT_1083916 [Melampsora americana]|nr:hypothetical protein DFH28DRAFT_1083916 [Melampsora americana]